MREGSIFPFSARRFAGPPIVAILLAGSGGCDADPTGSGGNFGPLDRLEPSTIILGTLAGDAYANVGVRVVRLAGNQFWQFAQFGCTATLIAPRVALTAGHCVANHEGTGNELGVVCASDVGLTGIPSSRVVTAVGHVHPRYKPGPLTEREYDLAVLILAEPFAEITPARLPRPGALALAAVNEANDQLVMVGYGVSNFPPPPPGNAGRRQFAVMDIEELDGSRLIVRSPDPTVSACLGDSGGPYAHAGNLPRGNGAGHDYLKEVLAVFYGSDGCEGDNYGWRVDEPTTLAWLREFIEAAAD